MLKINIAISLSALLFLFNFNFDELSWIAFYLLPQLEVGLGTFLTYVSAFFVVYFLSTYLVKIAFSRGAKIRIVKTDNFFVYWSVCSQIGCSNLPWSSCTILTLINFRLWNEDISKNSPFLHSCQMWHSGVTPHLDLRSRTCEL